jgi:hypothetical protein
LQPGASLQALSTTEKLKPADGYPDVTLPTGEWQVALPGKWVSGFFGGVLWQLHSLTGKQQWQDLAQQWQKELTNRQRVSGSSSCDFGFRQHDNLNLCARAGKVVMCCSVQSHCQDVLPACCRSSN